MNPDKIDMNWNQHFIYNPDGTLTRLHSNNQHTTVGWVNSEGYMQLEHAGKNYMLHRVIWEWHYGALPKGYQIDHRDRNPLNNLIENLRPCTQLQNKQNQGIQKNNTLGYRGVIRTPNGKYQARLGHKGVKLYLGLFDTAEQASACIEQKRVELHGEFAA